MSFESSPPKIVVTAPIRMGHRRSVSLPANKMNFVERPPWHSDAEALIRNPNPHQAERKSKPLAHFDAVNYGISEPNMDAGQANDDYNERFEGKTTAASMPGTIESRHYYEMTSRGLDGLKSKVVSSPFFPIDNFGDAFLIRSLLKIPLSFKSSTKGHRKQHVRAALSVDGSQLANRDGEMFKGKRSGYNVNKENSPVSRTECQLAAQSAKTLVTLMGWKSERDVSRLSVPLDKDKSKSEERLLDDHRYESVKEMLSENDRSPQSRSSFDVMKLLLKKTKSEKYDRKNRIRSNSLQTTEVKRSKSEETVGYREPVYEKVIHTDHGKEVQNDDPKRRPSLDSKRGYFVPRHGFESPPPPYSEVVGEDMHRSRSSERGGILTPPPHRRGHGRAPLPPRPRSCFDLCSEEESPYASIEDVRSAAGCCSSRSSHGEKSSGIPRRKSHQCSRSDKPRIVDDNSSSTHTLPKMTKQRREHKRPYRGSYYTSLKTLSQELKELRKLDAPIETSTNELENGMDIPVDSDEEDSDRIYDVPKPPWNTPEDLSSDDTPDGSPHISSSQIRTFGGRLRPVFERPLTPHSLIQSLHEELESVEPDGEGRSQSCMTMNSACDDDGKDAFLETPRGIYESVSDPSCISTKGDSDDDDLKCFKATIRRKSMEHVNARVKRSEAFRRYSRDEAEPLYMRMMSDASVRYRRKRTVSADLSSAAVVRRALSLKHPSSGNELQRCSSDINRVKGRPVRVPETDITVYISNCSAENPCTCGYVSMNGIDNPHRGSCSCQDQLEDSSSPCCISREHSPSTSSLSSLNLEIHSDRQLFTFSLLSVLLALKVYMALLSTVRRYEITPRSSTSSSNHDYEEVSTRPRSKTFGFRLKDGTRRFLNQSKKFWKFRHLKKDQPIDTNVRSDGEEPAEASVDPYSEVFVDESLADDFPPLVGRSDSCEKENEHLYSSIRTWSGEKSLRNSSSESGCADMDDASSESSSKRLSDLSFDSNQPVSRSLGEKSIPGLSYLLTDADWSGLSISYDEDKYLVPLDSSLPPHRTKEEWTRESANQNNEFGTEILL